MTELVTVKALKSFSGKPTVE